MIYTDNTGDKKLTDLYEIDENNKVTKENENAEYKVKVKLAYVSNGKIKKEAPDEFNKSTGEYKFTDVPVKELENLKVVFEYDGFYYTAVSEKLDRDEGSKVRENVTEREELNEKFDTVTADGKILPGDKDGNTVTYKTENNQSTVEKINFNTTISADTEQTQYDFWTIYSGKGQPDDIENVNMGLVLREQPDLAISEDIEKVTVTLNGYSYDYMFDTRYQYLENGSGFDVGVKFENQYSSNRYSSTIYSSDIKALEDKNATLGVQIKYKVTIKNQSTTLSIEPKQLVNYFDNRYTVSSVKLAEGSNGEIVFNKETAVSKHDDSYNKAVIGYTGKIEAGGQRVVEITFDLSESAILDLLNEKSTYYNATEILSYATYYGEKTSTQETQGEDKYYITEQAPAGTIYAGIDRDSAPGNAKIELEETTQKLKTSTFEDDTDSSPSLILEAGNVRAISGKVWEDTDNKKDDNQILGNGSIEGDERLVGNVKVELWQVVADENGNIKTQLAKYSDGVTDAVTTTSETGEYRFGKLDKENKEYIGILPGTYFIKYVYNNETYVVMPRGNKNINILDYKSTIITSDVIKSAINNPETEIEYAGTKYSGDRWYLIEEPRRYSDAIDNMERRKEIETAGITYSTYEEIADKSMEAQTPIMDIGIEFTSIDSAPAMFYNDKGELIAQQFVSEFNKVDFGIIKMGTDITVDKKITGLEIIAQNGTNIVPKADPSNAEVTMQYVKTGLEGLVPAEIESNLLQGAELELEYSITVKNNSPIDYEEANYYYYGTDGATLKESGVEIVVDYLDNTLKLDANKDNASWTEVKDIKEKLLDEGLISEEVYEELKTGKYTVLLTDEFKDIKAGKSKTVKLYTSKFLAVSDEIKIDNRVEIIKLSGGRTIQDSIPGNLIPSQTGYLYGKENDTAVITFTITPPTGTTVNYVAYIIAISAMLLIITAGIIIIKKKVIKKQ